MNEFMKKLAELIRGKRQETDWEKARRRIDGILATYNIRVEDEKR